MGRAKRKNTLKKGSEEPKRPLLDVSLGNESAKNFADTCYTASELAGGNTRGTDKAMS